MGGLEWEELAGDQAVIRTDRGGELARYSYRRDKNHPFFYDVRAPGQLAIVTNHAPWDHRWHHGLWWSWKFINDVLYWEDHPAYGGNRTGLGRSQVESHEVAPTPAGGLRVIEQLSWRDNEQDRSVLSEERVLDLRPQVPGLDAGWLIDWSMVWTAAEDLTFSTTPYPEISWGGYAGLNYRPARSLAAQEAILGTEGRTSAGQLHGQPAAWMAYTGCLDGAETDEPNAPAIGGLAIFEHAANPGFPNCAYATSAAGGFGFLAAAPLMGGDRRLATGGQLRLRYRTAILGSAPSAEQLRDASRQYQEDAAAEN